MSPGEDATIPADVDLFLLWAKSHEGRIHPLPCHLIDVASVAQELWDHALPNAARQRIAGALNVSESAAGGWLAFWTGLHDLGKASPAFQAQDAGARGRLERAGYRFHLPIDGAPHGTITTATLPAAVAMIPALPISVVNLVATAIGGHHGVFPRSGDRPDERHAVGKGLWRTARADLASLLASLIKLPVDDVPRAIDATTAVWLAGFVTIADWIGSNTTYFPLAVVDSTSPEQIDPRSYQQLAEEQATRALRALGWTTRPASSAPHGFAEMFPGTPLPNNLQQAIVTLAPDLSEPSLVVVEAPMGEGKTEAALYLVAAGHASSQRGAYVALPTQATSNQMFSRVRDFLSTRFHDDTINLQLLHGQAALSTEFEVLRGRWDDLFQPTNISGATGFDGASASVVAAEWFTYRKRGLLAPFGVGTIDQALFAVLQTRHGFVRLFGLADKTIVIDEVHAYDAYMSTLLERLLEWLAALGSSVVLLSATLPATRRECLLAAFAHGLGRKELPRTTAVAYPRLTWLTAAAHGAMPVTTSARATKTVQIRWIDSNDAATGIQLSALVDRLRHALDHGGCVAVVCNTVGRAQDVYRAFKPHFPGIASDGEPELDLLHARFLFEERERRELRVLRRFGKPTQLHSDARPDRAILVATQIIEQSLDLDFDLMISDPAPVDLLLQRLGRLHRHPRPRPGGLGHAELWIHQPPDIGGVPTFDAGTTAVYDAHILLRSWLALQRHPALHIPGDVEALIEAVYADNRACPPDLPDPLCATWEQTRQDLDLTRVDDEAKAKVRRVLPPYYLDDIFEDRNLQLEEDDPSAHPTVQALTRLGDRSISVVLLDRTAHDALSRATVPTVPEAKVLLRRSVAISSRRVVYDLERMPVPSGWKRSPLLRHHRLLTLDDAGGAAVGSYRLVLDPDLGIRIDRA